MVQVYTAEVASWLQDVVEGAKAGRHDSGSPDRRGGVKDGRQRQSMGRPESLETAKLTPDTLFGALQTGHVLCRLITIVDPSCAMAPAVEAEPGSFFA